MITANRLREARAREEANLPPAPSPPPAEVPYYVHKRAVDELKSRIRELECALEKAMAANEPKLTPAEEQAPPTEMVAPLRKAKARRKTDG